MGKTVQRSSIGTGMGKSAELGMLVCLSTTRIFASVQSLNSLLGRPSLQEGGTGISWRIVKSMLSKCLEMLVPSTNW